MKKYFLLPIALTILCSCATNPTSDESQALLFSSGKLQKYIKMPPNISAEAPTKTLLDPSGAAIATAKILSMKKNISISEEQALSEIFEKGNRMKIIERNGAISFQDIANVLEAHGLKAKGSQTRFSSDGSYRKDSMMTLSFLGNQKTELALPFIALLRYQKGNVSYFIVVDGIDKKYLYAIDPYKGRIALEEADFINHSPMVVFAN